MGRPKLAIQVPCTHCQILVWRQPCKLKLAQEIFCSKQCQGAYRERPLADRLWEKVDRSGGPDACWPWTGSRTKQGYGQISFGHNERLYTHRVAYELTHGILLPGFWVLHHCDNQPCCNPHKCLFPGTQLDNIHDATEKRRIAFGINHWNAKLTDIDVQEILNLRGVVSTTIIARRFHISTGHVSNIHNNKVRIHREQ